MSNIDINWPTHVTRTSISGFVLFSECDEYFDTDLYFQWINIQLTVIRRKNINNECRIKWGETNGWTTAKTTKKKLHFQIVNCMTYCLMVSLRMLFLWSKWGKKSRSIEENPSLRYISIAILQQITGALTILFSFYFSLVSPPLLPIICYYFYTFCLFISAYYLWIFIYTGSYSRTCVHFTFFFILNYI